MFSIIIPVWNQGRQLQDNFPGLINTLREINDAYEIILVDDGSADNTPILLQNIRDSYDNIKIERLTHLGQYLALLAGFKIAKGDVIITMDANMKVPPVYIPEFLDKIKKGYDIVVAWRCCRPGLGFLRKLGSFLINKYTNLITGKMLHDHACSLKAFSTNLVKINLERLDLNNFFPIMIDKYARRICEVRVMCEPKSSRESALNILGLLRQAMCFIVNTSLNMRL